MEEMSILINGKEHKVSIEQTESGKFLVSYGGEAFQVETRDEISDQLIKGIEIKKESHEKGIVQAPLPGIVHSIEAKVGEEVEKGKKLLSMMAMKMENEIVAPVSGKIKEIAVKKGQTVNKGDVLVVIG